MFQTKASILIIDDDRVLGGLIGLVMETHSYRSVVATTPSEGLEKAGRLKPNLILLDLALPQMSGLGVLRRLKSDPALSHIPVVVLTGNDDGEVESECLSLGAERFLSKGMDFNELIVELERIGRRHHPRHQGASPSLRY